MARRPFFRRLRGSALRLHSSGRAAHSRRNGLSPAPPVPAAPESATFSIQHKKNAVHHTSGPLNTIKSRSLAPASQPVECRSLRLSKGRCRNQPPSSPTRPVIPNCCATFAHTCYECGFGICRSWHLPLYSP